MNHYKVLVTGSRDITDQKNKRILHVHLSYIAEREREMLCIIEGGARGVDTLAAELARREAWDHVRFDANWEGRGRSAGPQRNQWMLDVMAPDIVVAMPREGSRGTKDMIDRAKKAGIKVDILTPVTS